MSGLCFPEQSWVDAWVQAMNADARLRDAGAEWSGCISCVITREVPDQAGPVYLLLCGAHGHWDEAQVGSTSTSGHNVVVRIEGRYDTWRLIITQQLHPIRAMIQGRLRVHGQLSVILKWSRAITLMTELAGNLDTVFVEEA